MAVLAHADVEVVRRPRIQRKKCSCGGRCADCGGGKDEEQGGGAVAQLLQLQRSAGNGAVAAAMAGLVQRQDDDDGGSTLVEQESEPAAPVASGDTDTAAGGADSGLGGLLDGAAGALAGLPDIPGLPGLPSLPKLPIPDVPGLGGGDGPGGGGLIPDLPELPKLPKLPKLPDVGPCKPAPTKAVAEALHLQVLAGITPVAGRLGSTTLDVWFSYLQKADPSIPRAGRSFAGSGEIPDGFRDHHKTAESEREIVETAAKELAGAKFALLPAPGATVLLPVSSVIDPATLRARINNASDAMGLDYDGPATTIPGNLAGGIGAGGGPGGGGSLDKDTRDASGFLEVTRDPAGTSVTIKPKLTFKVHDTVDFCPGNLGKGLAQGLTVPMSILEATENRFGPVYAADVPFDVEHPGPGTIGGPFPIPSTPPTPPPVPPTPGVFPKSGPAKTTGTLLRVRTGPSLSAPTLRLIEAKDTDIEVISQVRGDPVDGNDVWDQISDGFVSDRFVEFQEVFVP